MSPKEQRAIARKLKVLNLANETGNVSKVCRYYGISRELFYRWKHRHEEQGEKGLIDRKHGPSCSRLRTSPVVEEKVLYLRKTYHFGPLRITWYLLRYHNVKLSTGGVRNVLKRHGLNRLPRNLPKKAVEYKRYEKQVPGHHVQVDVKFLKIIDSKHKPRKRYQYTAIDDATRIRVLRIYKRHNQNSSIDFANHVIKTMPFKIHMVRTDNGHEFQSLFHWNLEDQGIRHVYIKPGTPRLNGKVERSHRIDKEEFYQLLDYVDDDGALDKKLNVWERFYNFNRPHGSLGGKTPYETLRLKLAK